MCIRDRFDTANQQGVHFVRDDQLGLLELPQRIAELREKLAHVDLIYLTIDIDGLPHAMAPGVSAPAARGVPMEVVEPLLDAIAATGKLKLMDVAELAPPLDRDNGTARVAARLIHRVTDAAVSYTHLDVYKRQMSGCPVATAPTTMVVPWQRTSAGPGMGSVAS